MVPEYLRGKKKTKVFPGEKYSLEKSITSLQEKGVTQVASIVTMDPPCTRQDATKDEKDYVQLDTEKKKRKKNIVLYNSLATNPAPSHHASLLRKEYTGGFLKTVANITSLHAEASC
ncbi:hypothetical protein E2C01_064269 [Portunus trituberculatus]|uniref:Uncharacterized protein n=1 Tax=Portunus trituberculatus TaxID=210409 RepID=A0A5B7HNB3_PORTR|nr:hypothetical protein [Portunus trituberculatus]